MRVARFHWLSPSGDLQTMTVIVFGELALEQQILRFITRHDPFQNIDSDRAVREEWS